MKATHHVGCELAQDPWLETLYEAKGGIRPENVREREREREYAIERKDSDLSKFLWLYLELRDVTAHIDRFRQQTPESESYQIGKTHGWTVAESIP